MSELETAEGAGEFVHTDQGETVPAGASPGESRTTSKVSEDKGEGRGEVGRKSLREIRGGVASIWELREVDGVCRSERGSGMLGGSVESSAKEWGLIRRSF